MLSDIFKLQTWFTTPAADEDGNVVHCNNVQAKSQDLAGTWAKEIVEISSGLEQLIDRLPELGSSEAEDLKRIAKLMEQNELVGDELREETAKTEEVLAQVRTLYGQFADQELTRRANEKLSKT